MTSAVMSNKDGTNHRSRLPLSSPFSNTLPSWSSTLPPCLGSTLLIVPCMLLCSTSPQATARTLQPMIYGLYSYGLYSYGLYSAGLYSYGPGDGADLAINEHPVARDAHCLADICA